MVPRHFGGRVDHVGDQGVHRVDAGGPGSGGARHLGPMIDLALPADDFAEPIELPAHSVVQLHDVVERLSQIAVHPGQIVGQTDREIPASERAERSEQLAIVEGGLSQRGSGHRALTTDRQTGPGPDKMA
jgi:hypothetical protein